MIDLKEVNPPVNPCPDCISLAQSQGNMKFVYCVHNHAGGIWLNTGTGGMWNVYSPIVLDNFTDVVSTLSETFIHKEKIAFRNKPLTAKH